MKTAEEIEQRVKEWAIDIIKMERNKLVDADLNRGLHYAAMIAKGELEWVLR